MMTPDQSEQDKIRETTTLINTARNMELDMDNQYNAHDPAWAQTFDYIMNFYGQITESEYKSAGYIGIQHAKKNR